MSGVELGLAIVAFVDLCNKYGRSLVETCLALRHADARLSESVVRIEACWLRVETQLQFVRGLAARLDERHRDVQQRTLEVLLSKLQVADSKLASLRKKAPGSSADAFGLKPLTVDVKRWKYALMRDGLSEAISDLEAWQAIFDPSWFFMLKLAGPEVDGQLEVLARQQTGDMPASKEPSISTTIPAAKYLRRALAPETATDKPAVFLLREGLVPDSIRAVPFSPVSTARRSANGQAVLVDPVTCTSRPNVNLVLKDIRSFARKLQHANPFVFGLLECKGILKDESEAPAAVSSTGLSFVFRLPPTHSAVHSVRHRLLLAGPEHESLSEKFALARQLVTAISYVHLYGFVHKNIRPETILMITPSRNVPSNTIGVAAGEENRPDASETAVLVGFDVLRDADGRTCRVGDDIWEHNLYRHPHRQGRTPESDYEMRHDIYSVGVCLLEIGLWESFVTYDAKRRCAENGDQSGPQTEIPQPEPATAEDELVALLGQGLRLRLRLGAVGEAGDKTGVELLKDPLRLKDSLVGLARGRLRRKMGTKYSKIVETCLTCLDRGNEDFGDEKDFQDEDGIAVGVRYIEKVVLRLGEIVV